MTAADQHRMNVSALIPPFESREGLAMSLQFVQVFFAIVYIGCALYICLALYSYVADAVAQRSIFPSSSMGTPVMRLGPPMALLFILPRMVLREYSVHIPDSIASMLDTISFLAMLVLFVLGIKIIVTMLRSFNRAPRNSSN
ncbi:MAG TPA: hypothetical protein VGJ20_25415 [Xanthobacteraceae bacterium]|jgi:hypothetical protein